ncbi:MAG: putative ABC transporter permease [Oscillospiraceae bacterium]|nr:putative ABC transporter permease [Oscillospiraceae bacterium]
MIFYTLEKYFLYFILYAVIGWIYESILCSVTSRKFVNRGFLNGPYCPIYGAGALLNILILGKIKNPVLLFFSSAILTCSLEYITSYAMEKMFHARWWDYSDSKFNIKGRVCLLGAVVFGMLSVLLILFIHPFVSKYIDSAPRFLLHIASGTLFAIFTADCVVTISGFTSFNARLKEFSEYLGKKKEDAAAEFEKFRKENVSLKLNSAYEMFLLRLNSQHRRMIKGFPKLKSIRYEEALNKLHTSIYEFRKHRRISKQIKK